METNTNAAQPTITLDQLTPAQVKALRAQMNAERKSLMGNVKERQAVIDPMLHETEGDGFKHTTSDILAALQVAKLVKSELTKEQRDAEIKRIQTRKQLLERKPEHKGKVGYKVSAVGFGPLTPEKAIAHLVAAGYGIWLNGVHVAGPVAVTPVKPAKK